MSRCDPDMGDEDPRGDGRVTAVTCLDCGATFLATVDWQRHLAVAHPDSHRRSYDVPLWES